MTGQAAAPTRAERACFDHQKVIELIALVSLIVNIVYGALELIRHHSMADARTPFIGVAASLLLFALTRAVSRYVSDWDHAHPRG